MNVVVLHDNGLLGRVLLERLRKRSAQVTPLLISRPESLGVDDLHACLPPDADLIINVLGAPDPMAAEADPEMARHMVFTLPLGIADYCVNKGAAMIQLSSSYIFDGRKQSAYISSNPGHPFGQLGGWQWECEQALRALLPRHVILRTGWMLEPLVNRVLAQCEVGGTLSMPGRCRGQPVALQDLARVLTAMVLQLDCGAEVWGTYQYAGAEEVSLYELGQVIVGQLGERCKLNVIDAEADWSRLEPANTTLGCIKIRNTFGIKQIPWRHELREEIRLVSTARQPRMAPAGN